MPNTITNVLPKMLAQGVLALRQNAVTPRLVNRDYETIAAGLGNAVNIPIPSSIAARSVTPSVVMNSNVAVSPTVAIVTLDRWMEAPWELTDNDRLSADPTILPMEASEAIKSLANDADQFLLGKHVGFYGFGGTAGTTPFATLITAAADARKRLNKQLAPVDQRFGMLDPDAESNFLQLANILDTDKRGDQGGIISGSVGTKLGIDWYMNQNVQTHTPGTLLTMAPTNAWAVSGANATVGVSTITIVHATATGSLKIGDIFTLGAGQYVITAAATVTVVASEVAISFYPALATAAASASTVTFICTAYVANVVANKYALAWASRPLRESLMDAHVFQAPTDPISGIALRLEISRQYKLETLSYDYLAGAGVVRRELGSKILG